jgi:uncharacterized protein (DUF433 family)
MGTDRSASTDRVVSRDPNVMSGALVFAGTRVPVDTLIQHLAAGDSLDDFLNDFPTVRREQAIAYLEMALEKTKESDARAA